LQEVDIIEDEDLELEDEDFKSRRRIMLKIYEYVDS
jgi:hypothetical protein